MQICGFDEKKIILARDAFKGKNYICPECRQPIRVRQGIHRRPHFFHLHSNRRCTQSQKTLQHLNTQLTILSLLSEKQAHIEKRFPEINRIADIYWEKEKIVFEVQCSPISFEEAVSREKDYAKLGISVIWILHDKRFNRKKLSAAEAHIRQRTSYFTSINEEGKGKIYDQYECLKHGKRLFKGTALPVNIRYPRVMIAQETPLPKILQLRTNFSQFYFPGDLFDRANKKENFNAWMLKTEKKLQLNQRQSKTPFPRIFQIVFYYLLKKLAI